MRTRLAGLGVSARPKPDVGEPAMSPGSAEGIGGWVPTARVGDALRALSNVAGDTSDDQDKVNGGRGEPGGQPSPGRRRRLVDVVSRSGQRLQGDWQLGRLHVVVVAAALAVALGSAGLVYASSRPEVEPIGAATEATGTPMSGGEPSDRGEGDANRSDDRGGDEARESDDVVVHVAGLVERPGLVTLRPGSRVIDAVEAAGGAKDEANLGALNLARRIGDGEQIVVSDDPPPAQPPTGQQAALVNLNTATVEQLETLPGIGPAIGTRIIEWRDKHGRFAAVDELLEVSGIGESTLAELEPLVTV